MNTTDHERVKGRLLVISNDRLLFDKGSDVRNRQSEYAKNWEEVHIIVFSKKDKSEDFIDPNIWIYPTRSRIKLWWPFDAMTLAQFIIERRGITHISCQDPFETGFVGVHMKKKNPSLWLELQCHTDPGNPYFKKIQFLNRIRLLLAKLNLPFANHVRVVSQKGKDYMINYGVIPDNIEIRPIQIDSEKIRNAPISESLKEKYPQFKKIILMASRITKEKNISLAINILSLLKKNGKEDTGLIIVGRGPEKERLLKMVNNLDLDRQIIFEPWVNNDVLYSYYKTADLFLNTSFFEGYGMSMVEAKSAGLKVVSTDVGIAKDIGAQIIDNDPSRAMQKIILCL